VASMPRNDPLMTDEPLAVYYTERFALSRDLQRSTLSLSDGTSRKGPFWSQLLFPGSPWRDDRIC